MNTFKDRLAAQFQREADVRYAVDSYFALPPAPTFTGSRFEALADADRPNEITARDVVAVSTLSVDIPPRVAAWLLSAEGRETVTGLLVSVPVGLNLWESEAAEAVERGGSLWRLWELLGSASWPQSTPANGMGPTRVSKLLTAKRSGLVPVSDSVVRSTLGPTRDYWADMRNALLDDDLRAKILNFTSGAPEGVSLLRRIDVVIWFWNRTGAPSPDARFGPTPMPGS